MTTCIFLVYKTDKWHSYKSRDIIGVGTTKQTAIKLVYAQAEKEDEEIDESQAYNIENMLQTQGYSGDGEFQIEEIKTNTLL